MLWRRAFGQTRRAFNLYRSPTDDVCSGRVSRKGHLPIQIRGLGSYGPFGWAQRWFGSREEGPTFELRGR